MIRRIRDEYIDWKLGIHTTGFIHRSRLCSNSSSRDYVASDYRSLTRLFKQIDIDGDTMVEYGCGKGRVLIVAGTYPFRRIIGVEQSEELCSIAKQNVQHTKAVLQCDVKVVRGDAAEFDLPDETSVVFMFNPFGKDVIDRVKERITHSLESRPRPFRLIYIFPATNNDYFSSFDLLTLTKEISPIGWKKFQIRVYSTA